MEKDDHDEGPSKNTLSEITADLVEFEENEPFLERLFQLKPGVWTDLDCLCDDLDGYSQTLKTLRESFQERARVTWLAYPDSKYGDGYCLIIFFTDHQQWHNVALYNKQRLEQAMKQINHFLVQAV